MKDKIIVYGKCSGVATTATFLGNQWWVTSKDEKLEPLYEDSPYDKSDYRYLCEKDELILVKDLAGMMGCALECGETDIKEVLKSRFKDINAMGVKFQAVPQVLNLKVRVFSNKGTQRQGKYSVWCDDADSTWMRLFDLDAFEDAKTALHWSRVYIDFFMKHGVCVKATLECTEEILEQLPVSEYYGMKVEIENLNK